MSKGDQKSIVAQPTQRAPELEQALRAAETFAEGVSARLGRQHAAIARVFQRCFLNTLATTTAILPDGTTYIFTGDIPALWLRDSLGQVLPYMPLARREPVMARLLAGLIRRHAAYVTLDPYANAFNSEGNGAGHARDRTAMSPWVWERKFALDSLCAPIQLCHAYWHATDDRAVFDATVRHMFQTVLRVMRVEQRHAEASPYRFERLAFSRRDTLSNSGRGSPVATTGMVWSGFRPSDDACAYHFHLPANMAAVVALQQLAELAREVYHDNALAEEADGLAREVDAGIQRHGLVAHPRYGRIYAYETDGMGHHALLDDANIPSLLSIPFLGYRPHDDPDYQRTRAFVLSRDNPHYAVGRYARGVGSAHTRKNTVWPLGLIVQGLTSTDSSEQEYVLQTLVSTTAGTGLMHESFDPHRPERFTRPWFAWANSMFALLVCKWVGAGL